MTRVAVVDLGSNSTRLLIADVDEGGGVQELERRSIVTRLAQDVDRTQCLSDEAMERVFATLTEFRETIDGRGADTVVGVLTSAARDADNGTAFAAAVRERFAIDARTIPGDEEARLSFLGATSERAPDRTPTAVIDVGGGSTEMVVGIDGEIDFHVSTQVGVVRHSERHLHGDPPRAAELAALREDAAAAFAAAVPAEVRARVRAGIAVAGTPTMAAAMELELDVHDPDRVHGHVLGREVLETLLGRLAALALAERRGVRGLHPDRAATIVAGIAVLLEAMACLGLERVEVSEHDVLRGVALEHGRG